MNSSLFSPSPGVDVLIHTIVPEDCSVERILARYYVAVKITLVKPWAQGLAA
jgi:hypothetical protein